MPELPEVEAMRRSLSRRLENARLLEVVSLRTGYPDLSQAELRLEDLRDASIVRLDRRGKYLIWRLILAKGDFALVCHPRMTGHFLWHDETLPLPPHVHVLLRIRDNKGEPGILLWQDVRRFGTLELLPAGRLLTGPHALLKLGPEADSWQPDVAALVLSQRGRRRSIAAWLLDQENVAGLGAIYVTEALHACGLDPATPTARLSRPDWLRLAAVVRDLLRWAMARGGSSISDYVDSDGGRGSFQLEHRIYGRYQKPCPDCQTPLARRTIGGRHIGFCPHCVRLPKKQLLARQDDIRQRSRIESGQTPVSDSSSERNSPMSVQNTSRTLYVGGYGGRRIDPAPAGLVSASLSAWSPLDTGELCHARSFAGVQDSSYVIPSPSGDLLLAVQESGRGGRFLIVDPRSDSDDPLAAVEIGAGGPCHLAVHENWVFTANYGSGSISCLRLTDDGRQARLVAVIQHSGSSTNKGRQEGPHTHWVGIDPDSRYLYAVDLGIDAVLRYPLDMLFAKFDTLPADAAVPVLDFAEMEHDRIVFPDGEGPRHMVFSADGRYGYVVTELGNRVFALDLSEPLPRVRDCGVAGGAEGEANYPAAIRLAPDGRHLATSIRGSNYIAIFALDGAAATRIQNLPCGGDWPRDLFYAADGLTLWCANERNHSITRFTVAADGTIAGGCQVAVVSSPACLLEVL
ncbi:MAG: beta-propeller fold lactonase family protein [Bacillota bacterium]|nr:beta-propeller fold lactonase family protein [Bacillota bacterium]